MIFFDKSGLKLVLQKPYRRFKATLLKIIITTAPPNTNNSKLDFGLLDELLFNLVFDSELSSGFDPIELIQLDETEDTCLSRLF